MSPDPAAAGRPLSFGIAALLLAALWAAVCLPWFAGGLVIPWDAKNHFYPQIRFLAASLAEGQSPFWAPYVFAGHPQIADPQSLIFSPIMLALALADAAPSFGRIDAAELAALLPGGIGMLLMFKNRGWRLEGALVAALAFMFGGVAATRLQHLGMILSYGLLPLALWLLMQALDRRSPLYGIAFGAVAALMAIGRDQVAFLGCATLAGYALYDWLARPNRLAYLRRRALAVAAAGVVGAALLAVPLLLTIEMAAMSNRPAFGFAVAAPGSLTPWALFTAFIPNFFGTLGTLDDYWGPGAFAWLVYDNQTDRAINYAYLGALPALLTAWHGIAGRRLGAREIRFFVAVFVVALLYALGHYTPVFRALFELPGVSLYRRPADALFLAGFALAAMAGYLVHRMLVDGLPRLSRSSSIAFGVAAVALAAVAIGFGGAHDRLLATVRAMLAALALCGLAAALVTLSIRWRGRPLAAAILLAVAMAADLGHHNAGQPFNARDRAEYADIDPARPNALAVALRARLAAESDRRFRVELLGLGGAWQNAALIHGLEGTLGYNPLRWADYEAATGAAEGSHMTRRDFVPLFPSYNSAMADLLGIRYLALGAPIETIDPKAKPGDFDLVARIGGTHVYANPRALPRVRVATEIAIADTAALIRTGAWPADPRRVAVLERRPPEWRDEPVTAAPGTATARLETYRHDEVVVNVEAARPAMLVLHDMFHPAWRATLDGAPATVYRANVLFRAVYVPAGRHVVRFTYHPISSAVARVRGRR